MENQITLNIIYKNVGNHSIAENKKHNVISDIPTALVHAVQGNAARTMMRQTIAWNDRHLLAEETSGAVYTGEALGAGFFGVGGGGGGGGRVTFIASSSVLPPACVRRGLLAVWNCAGDIWVGRTWNCTSSTFCSSLKALSVPVFRLEKALSVGAKTVRPSFESISCESTLSATLVLCSSLMNTVKRPSFLSMAITLDGPAGAGDADTMVGALGTSGTDSAGAAAGDWAAVRVQEMRKKMSNCFILLLCLNSWTNWRVFVFSSKAKMEDTIT